MDGDTLLMLSTNGSIEQLIACGLKTLKQQMTLKKLLGSCCSSSVVISSSGGSTPSLVSMSPHVQPSKKLTKKDLDALSPQDKSVYLMM